MFLVGIIVDYTYQSAGRARSAGAASGAGYGAANAGRASRAGAARGAPRRVLQVARVTIVWVLEQVVTRATSGTRDFEYSLCGRVGSHWAAKDLRGDWGRDVGACGNWSVANHDWVVADHGWRGQDWRWSQECWCGQWRVQEWTGNRGGDRGGQWGREEWTSWSQQVAC